MPVPFESLDKSVVLDYLLPYSSPVVCSQCASTWFEEIAVARFDGNQLVTPGRPMARASDTFYLYRCAACMKLHEPQMTASGSVGYKAHISMVEELDKVSSK